MAVIIQFTNHITCVVIIFTLSGNLYTKVAQFAFLKAVVKISLENQSLYLGGGVSATVGYKKPSESTAGEFGYEGGLSEV